MQSVSVVGEYMHYIEGLFLDNHGLSSRKATRKVVRYIEEIKPDIIQLHCIHGYYLNYKILFEYLNRTKIPVVWTFHDCWAFTGHCAHFVAVGCEKWKNECHDCHLFRIYPRAFVDCSKRNYSIKKELFSANHNLHIVPVSEWVADLTKQSFLKDKDIHVIRNGVDLSVFKPVAKKENNKFRVLGVSGVWTKSKGIDDFFRLRNILDMNRYEIILVGLSREQKQNLPEGIVGIEHTESVHELVDLYSSSNVFVNPTYADTFPTVNIEALACGTPVITYRTGGSPEAVSSETGWVLNQGDVEGIASIIKDLAVKDNNEVDLQRKACRERAEKEFDKYNCFEKYLDLYLQLLKK
jgi:glycosyltransferase involved in cell wall biosynthesis